MCSRRSAGHRARRPRSVRGELRLSEEQQVQQCRFEESAPTSYSLRGALESEGFVHQFSACAAALVFPLASAILTPTVRNRNCVAITEVIRRAFEVRDQKLACESADKQSVESPGSRGWEFNSAVATVAGLLAFGLVVDKPGEDDAMLQFFVGEKHYAFASNCYPRASSDGPFVVRGPAPDESLEDSANGHSWKRASRKVRRLALRDGWLVAPAESLLVASAVFGRW